MSPLKCLSISFEESQEGMERRSVLSPYSSSLEDEKSLKREWKDNVKSFEDLFYRLEESQEGMERG